MNVEQLRMSQSMLYESREGMLIGAQVVPRKYIDEFIPNWEAIDRLNGNEFRMYSNPDSLISQCKISAPLSANSEYALTRISGGREMPLKRDLISYDGGVGGYLVGKGAWLTGQILHEALTWEDPVLLSEHLGLLSVDGAEFDTNFSDTLHRNEWRSAPHLGYIVFAPSFRKFVRDAWRQTAVEHIVDQVFDLVDKKNGAAYTFRVATTLERMGELGLASSSSVFNKEMRYAAEQLRLELEYGTSAFAKKSYTLASYGVNCLSLTDSMAFGEPMTDQRIGQYITMVCAMQSIHIASANAVLSELPSGFGKLSALLNLKDTDLGYRFYDYDEVIADRPGQPLIQKNIFRQEIAKRLATFFQNKLSPMWGASYDYPDSEEIAELIEFWE